MSASVSRPTPPGDEKGNPFVVFIPNNKDDTKSLMKGTIYAMALQDFMKSSTAQEAFGGVYVRDWATCESATGGVKFLFLGRQKNSFSNELAYGDHTQDVKSKVKPESALQFLILCALFNCGDNLQSGHQRLDMDGRYAMDALGLLDQGIGPKLQNGSVDPSVATFLEEAFSARPKLTVCSTIDASARDQDGLEKVKNHCKELLSRPGVVANLRFEFGYSLKRKAAYAFESLGVDEVDGPAIENTSVAQFNSRLDQLIAFCGAEPKSLLDLSKAPSSSPMQEKILNMMLDLVNLGEKCAQDQDLSPSDQKKYRAELEGHLEAIADIRRQIGKEIKDICLESKGGSALEKETSSLGDFLLKILSGLLDILSSNGKDRKREELSQKVQLALDGLENMNSLREGISNVRAASRRRTGNRGASENGHSDQMPRLRKAFSIKFTSSLSSYNRLAEAREQREVGVFRSSVTQSQIIQEIDRHIRFFESEFSIRSQCCRMQSEISSGADDLLLEGLRGEVRDVKLFVEDFRGLLERVRNGEALTAAQRKQLTDSPPPTVSERFQNLRYNAEECRRAGPVSQTCAHAI